MTLLNPTHAHCSNNICSSKPTTSTERRVLVTEDHRSPRTQLRSRKMTGDTERDGKTTSPPDSLYGSEFGHSETTNDLKEAEYILNNVTLAGTSTTRIDTTVNINNIVLSDYATLYVPFAQSLNNLTVRDRSIAFLVSQTLNNVHVTGNSHGWFGGEYYDNISPNKGVIIYREACDTTRLNSERACLQCRLAGETCMPDPELLLRGYRCARCTDLYLFCALSEAWSAGYDVAREWFNNRNGRAPTIAVVEIPSEQHISSADQPAPSIKKHRGLRLVGTGHGFINERQSRSNRGKLLLERIFGSQLLWWPFAEPLRYEDVSDIEIWICVSQFQRAFGR